MKGLHINIFRSDYDSKLNAFFGKKSITLVRVIDQDSGEPTGVQPPQIFESSVDYPEAELVRRYIGSRAAFFIRPLGRPGGMCGGTFASDSDSRFSALLPFYGAVSIHDRYE